jgi:hypothetical protein
MKPFLDYEGNVTNGDNNEKSSQFEHTKCPIGVTFEDIKKVIELLELKNELHQVCKAKIKSLKLDENEPSKRLFGLQYNMENREKAVEEGQEDLKEAKKALLKVQLQIRATSDAICDFQMLIFENCHVFLLDLKFGLQCLCSHCTRLQLCV